MTDGRWIFYFDAPCGSRILRSRFIGISTFDHNLWWSYEHKKWLPLDECGVQGASSMFRCHSFKAFKSHLRRHPELQTSGSVTLCSRFVGYDISATWFKEFRARPVGRFVVTDPNRYLSNLVGSAGL